MIMHVRVYTRMQKYMIRLQTPEDYTGFVVVYEIRVALDAIALIDNCFGLNCACLSTGLIAFYCIPAM